MNENKIIINEGEIYSIIINQGWFKKQYVKENKDDLYYIESYMACKDFLEQNETMCSKCGSVYIQTSENDICTECHNEIEYNKIHYTEIPSLIYTNIANGLNVVINMYDGSQEEFEIEIEQV